MSQKTSIKDTDSNVSDALIERIRKTPIVERLRQMMVFCQFGKDVMAADIRRRCPEITEEDFKREMLTRLYGSEFAEKACRSTKD